ncbi:hypothetical protein [Planctomicrobium piriforme]|uniref:Uncharacterized protein n=1 Tax=Planctomicrobium piriforme TaxID=1576369 RepID=A0A1I3AXL8_9PLAN|nr:hypothetical protein [Planctomicrobium piriforme]SFH54835.1 hypothetical protein SAMN05421753_101114 [Planctomicrobium piriforme]
MTLLAVHAGADDGQDPRLSPAAEQAANAKSEKIKAELTKDAKPWWAGRYSEGDGMGANTSIILAPDAGFVYQWHGCLGIYDRNFGAVQEADGRVELAPALPLATDLAPLLTKYIPVRWQSRKYLIPEEKMLEFCNKFNAGDLQRTFGNPYFLVETSTRESPAKGKPEVPTEFQKYLLDRPVICQIQEVRKPKIAYEKSQYPDDTKDDRFSSTSVSLNKGQDDGFFVGMVLYRVNHYGVSGITVTSVDKNSSEAVFRENVTLDGIPTLLPLVGWDLSTSPRRPSNE